MAKRKTTTEKKTLTEAQQEQPVITIQSITNTQDMPDTLFDCMKRRREKEH
jgi:hypothetical protein